jgi:hypothetical protein
MANATSAAAFIATLGINTHIDFDADGYQNLANVESDIAYLGVKIIRDSAEVATDAQTWLQVAQATGAKFDDYIAEGSPADMAANLALVTQLAQEGILTSIEGGDEEDDAYPVSLGNSAQITAQFQQQVYALGQQLGLPVINMSFGAGWTAANNWEGDYPTVGNLAGYANYANAHTYPLAGQLPGSSIATLNTLAQMAASNRPVITTEIGWSTATFSETTIAKYVLDATMDGITDGDAGMYFYGLFDDGSGNWGLFNADGTPRPAATALHDLTSLLADTGANAATFTPGSLNDSLSGTETGDNSMLIEKSDGSFWLSLWNETEAANTPHTVTVNLGVQATTVVEYDPLTGTSSIASWSNVSSVQVSVPDHPVLLEIVPAAGASTTTPATPATPAAPATPAPTGPTITAPASEATTTGASITLTGLSITDAFAASNPGTLGLYLSDTSGKLSIANAGGSVTGQGTGNLSVTGTLAQINADLAALSYTAAGSSGSDSIAVNVWDQAGLEGTATIAVTVTAPAPTVPTPTGPGIAVPAAESLATGATIAVTGIAVTDAFAASNPGTLGLYLSDTSGKLSIANATGTSVTGQDSDNLAVTGTLAQINADLAALSYTAASSSGSDSISVNVWDQAGLEGTATVAVTVAAPVPAPAPTPTGPSIAVPAAESLTTGATIAVTGVTVTDAFAASNPGTLGLYLSDSSGTLSVASAGGSVTGQGTGKLAVTGTLAQINADLAQLNYTAASSAGSDSINVNVWDQAGLESTATIGVTVTAPPPIVIAIAASNASPVITVNNATITANAGNHAIFIGGSGDVLTALGGTETVTANAGGNTITTGTGNDVIHIAGSGNMVNAGSGQNQIYDSGSGNTIVLPQAGQGNDSIYGAVLQDHDTLDLRALLAATKWNGSTATIGNFVHDTTVNASNTVISVTPSGMVGGMSYNVATLEGAGAVSLSSMLAHALV